MGGYSRRRSPWTGLYAFDCASEYWGSFQQRYPVSSEVHEGGASLRNARGLIPLSSLARAMCSSIAGLTMPSRCLTRSHASALYRYPSGTYGSTGIDEYEGRRAPSRRSCDGDVDALVQKLRERYRAGRPIRADHGLHYHLGRGHVERLAGRTVRYRRGAAPRATRRGSRRRASTGSSRRRPR